MRHFRRKAVTAEEVSEHRDNSMEESAWKSQGESEPRAIKGTGLKGAENTHHKEQMTGEPQEPGDWQGRSKRSPSVPEVEEGTTGRDVEE